MQKQSKRKKREQEYSAEELLKIIADLRDENGALKALIGDILKMLEKKL